MAMPPELPLSRAYWLSPALCLDINDVNLRALIIANHI